MRNSVALNKKDVRLSIRYPIPRGIGMYAVGMQNPCMYVSQAGNRFGIWSEIEADCLVITPITYGDKSNTSPKIDFLSNLGIFLSIDAMYDHFQ